MSFKKVVFHTLVLSVCYGHVNAAEWKIEPSLGLSTQYNDNVRMRTEANNPESSIGYTVDPRVNFAAEEQGLWNMSLNARGKLTRFQDIEDADSENVFISFDAVRQTERFVLSLKGSYSDNTNFDTDFDTKNIDSGLFDDKTVRINKSVSPSLRWNSSQSSVVIFSLSATETSYDELGISSSNLRDSKGESATIQAYWQMYEKHTLGYTISYSKNETPDVGFSSDTTVLNLDYTYKLSPQSELKLSVGGRRLDSLTSNVAVACDLEGFGPAPIEEVSNTGVCPDSFLGIPVTPILEDIPGNDDGTVVNLSYSTSSEKISQRFGASRNVIPSSTGGVQELQSASYNFNFTSTERLSSALLLDASETKTISGVDSTNDRRQYRIEPSVAYKIDRDWRLSFRYRYIEQNIANINADSKSNAVFVNLTLNWPKLATTY